MVNGSYKGVSSFKWAFKDSLIGVYKKSFIGVYKDLLKGSLKDFFICTYGQFLGVYETNFIKKTLEYFFVGP